MAMAIVLGVGVVILAKGTGLLPLVPFFGGLTVFTWAFIKWGCLSEEEH